MRKPIFVDGIEYAYVSHWKQLNYYRSLTFPPIEIEVARNDKQFKNVKRIKIKDELKKERA